MLYSFPSIYSFFTGLAECNFVQFNGGFSQDQLDWVDKVLTYADENQERVVIAGMAVLLIISSIGDGIKYFNICGFTILTRVNSAGLECFAA